MAASYLPYSVIGAWVSLRSLQVNREVLSDIRTATATAKPRKEKEKEEDDDPQ